MARRTSGARSAAYHVAGQAVVAHCLGYPVSRVSIGSPEGARAQCVVDAAFGEEHLAIFHAAGAVAELIARGRYSIGSPHADPSVRLPRMRARAIVEDQWQAVDTLATLLLGGHDLCRDDLTPILGDLPDDRLQWLAPAAVSKG